MRIFFAVAILALGVVARAQEPPPRPSNDDVDIAKAHFATGTAYYERGRYADAAREFEEAYRLSQRPQLLYNMGKAYDGGGDPARALRAYRRFLPAFPDSPDAPAVLTRVALLEKLVGRLKIESSVAGALVRVDGVEVGATPLADPVEVNPGAHSVEVVHEGYATWKANVVGAPGAVTNVEARPTSLVKIVTVEVAKTVVVQPPTQPVYRRWWLWTAVGAVVAAGAVTGGVLGSHAASAVPQPSAQLPTVR